MTRRRIALLCLLAGALLAALVPWTVRSDQVVAALARQIRQGYGIAVSSDGSLTLTLLPLPQLVLSGVRLASADGTVAAQADELRAQLRPLPILRGQIRLYKLWLAKSSITVTLTETPAPTIAGTLAGLRGRIGAEAGSHPAPRIDRFLLTDTDIGFRDGTGRELARLKGASLVLNSPDSDGDVDLTASGEWNGETAILSLSGLNLAKIREGRPQAVEGFVSGGMGRLSLDGRLTWADKPSFTGSIRAETKSIGRLARWTGRATDLAEFDGSGSIAGQGSIDLDAVQLPHASIAIGRDALEGAVAMQFGARPQLRATLAGEEIDLGWLGRIVDPAGAERLGGDYDIRLSASTLVFGSLRLRDAALSVQSTARSIEVSLGRASFAGGSLRGRISAALDGEGREIRALGWAEGVDLARALVDAAGIRGLSGTVGGQFALDIAGDRSEALLPQLRGRSTIQVRDGEFSGTTLAEASRQKAAALPPEWRAGRMPFAETRATVEFGYGQAEVTGGLVETGDMRARLGGRIDLATLNAALRITTLPGEAGAGKSRAPVSLDLSGPLRRLSISAAAETAPIP